MKKSKLAIMVIFPLATLLFSCGNNQKKETVATNEEPKSMLDQTEQSKDSKIASGKIVYEKVCQACHQADGNGLPNTFPPLAGSDYLAADLPRAIGGVVNGLTGEITVNGKKFNQTMPKSTLTDEEIAAAFTFVLNNFGNKGGEVNTADVKAVRK